MDVAGGTDWATLVPALAAALGIGSFAGAVVSTYGGKGRDRRQARSRALDGLERLEIARRTRPAAQGSYYDRQQFTELCAKCMIAGVPRYIVSVYDHFCEVGGRFTSVDDPGGWHVSYQAVMASIWLAEAARQSTVAVTVGERPPGGAALRDRA